MRRARLRELMAAEGLPSLNALARRVGLHRSTLSRWDRGLREPDEDTRDQFLAAFDGKYSEDYVFPKKVPA